MVKNTVYARYSETYDICTQVGKMSIIGVHTPTASSLKSMFKGFFEQYRKVKINSVDIVGVMASNMEALTPAEVGLTSGLVDPRDVLNPILFKACTGESLNLLLDRIYGSTGSDQGSMHTVETTDTSDINAYYSMLADDDFRKFHPQGGVRVAGLKPFVHNVVTTQPFKWSVAAADTPRIGSTANDGSANTVDASRTAYGIGATNGTAGGSPSVFVSNGVTDMPWIETTYQANGDVITPDGTESVLGNWIATNIPKCYCGVFLIPPSITTPLYMRWVFSWSISFKDFRPAYEIGPIGEYDVADTVGMGSATGRLYYNLYNQSKMLDGEYGSFDANGVDGATAIMEKVA